jgi:hypothetical protein
LLDGGSGDGTGNVSVTGGRLESVILAVGRDTSAGLCAGAGTGIAAVGSMISSETVIVSPPATSTVRAVVTPDFDALNFRRPALTMIGAASGVLPTDTSSTKTSASVTLVVTSTRATRFFSLSISPSICVRRAAAISLPPSAR